MANVLFRLGEKGLYTALRQRGGARFVILDIGTNDLTPKRPLTQEVLNQYALVLEAACRLSPKGPILVDEIHYRKDIGDELVDRSNEDLRQLVEDFNELLGAVKGRFSYGMIS